MIHVSLPECGIFSPSPALPLRILLVDDNAFDRKWIARMLHQSGMSIEVVSVGSLAAMRDALDDQPCDIVFLDCHLPGSTLTEALDCLLASACSKVLITGHEVPDVLQSSGLPLLQKALVSQGLLLSCLRRHCRSNALHINPCDPNLTDLPPKKQNDPLMH